MQQARSLLGRKFYFFMFLLIAVVVVYGFCFNLRERSFHINTIIQRLPYWITVAQVILR